MSGTAKPKTMSYWINTAIVLFCFFGFGLLPSIFGLSYEGMRCVGIFLGLLWGWIAVEFTWVSIIGIVAMGTTGAMTIGESITTAFMSTTFLQLIFPIILLAYLGQSGFAEWMAYKMLSMNALKGHPWRITAMIFVAASVLCFFITTFPMIFLMWALFLGVAEVAGYKPGDKYVGYVMCTIVMLQTVISASVPWGFYAVTLHALMADALGAYAFPFIPILVLGIVAQALCVVIALFIGKFIIRPDVSKMQNMPPEFYEKAAAIKLTTDGKVAFGVMLGLIVLMGFPSFFPNLAISQFFSGLGLHGVSVLLLAVLCMLRRKDGTPFTTVNQLSKIGLTWDIALLVASTLSLAALMKLPQVGIFAKVTGTLIPVVSQLPPTVFMFATLLLFWAVTQLTHNFVIVLTLVGAFAGICPAMGINPWVFGWMFMCGMSFAYSTPAASSPGALMYAHEWINKKDAYINGILFSLVGIIVFTIVMLPLATWMFGPLV